jgi:hypothetical protein
MKRLMIIFILAMLPAVLPAQALTRKEASQAKIKSVSEYETTAQNPRAKPLLESYTKYDAAGNLLEIIERDNTGYVTLHESYEYNPDGLKVIEIQYEPDGKIKKKHQYKYVNGLRSERLTYDRTGKLIATKKYEYEFFDK